MSETFHNLYTSTALNPRILKVTPSRRISLQFNPRPPLSLNIQISLNAVVTKDFSKGGMWRYVQSSSCVSIEDEELFRGERIQKSTFLQLFAGGFFGIYANFTRTSVITRFIKEFIPKPWSISFEPSNPDSIILNNVCVPSVYWRLNRGDFFYVKDFDVRNQLGTKILPTPISTPVETT